MAKYSFMKGLKNLKVLNYTRARQEIKDVFGVTSDESFRLHAHGRIEPTATEKEGVEAVFAKYGVKKSDIWGD